MNHSHQTTHLPLDAIGALALGQKIQAIKIVRSEKSLGLQEAKALVEAYEKEHPDIRPQHLIEHSASSSLWVWLVSFIAIVAALSLLVFK